MVTEPSSQRQRWLALLARTDEQELTSCLEGLTPPPDYELLRAPEVGLVMVRGRAGGTGRRFNLGEMTVTRAALRLPDGTVGHGHVAGRARRRAKLVALFDALLQQGSYTETIRLRLLDPVARRRDSQRERVRRQAAATRVDFFTMAREA